MWCGSINKSIEDMENNKASNLFHPRKKKLIIEFPSEEEMLKMGAKILYKDDFFTEYDIRVDPIPIEVEE